MSTQEDHQHHMDHAVAEAMQGFYNCHGDCQRWEPWEFDAEKKLLDKVRARVDREDGFN